MYFFFFLFTVCFSIVLNAAEDNLAPNDGDWPKDSSDAAPPASSSKHFSGRIRSSAWSKEEKEDLNPIDDKNKDQDTLLLDEESSLWNIKKLFRYVSSLFYAMNHNSDDYMDKSIDDLKTMMQSLTNNDLLDTFENNGKSEQNGKGEKQNSDNSDTLDKSSDDAKVQNRSNKRQLTENSKNKEQSSLDKDSIDKLENSMKTQTQNSGNSDSLNKSEDYKEKQNTVNNNALNKSSNDKKVQHSSNKDFPNDKQPTGNSKSKTDSADKSENNNKPETQNLKSPNILTKSVIDDDDDDSATNNTLNKSSNNRKMQESSNNDFSGPTEVNEKAKNNQKNSTDKYHLNKSTQGINMQKTSNNDIQLEQISSLKSDKSKEDVTKTAFKDYKDCGTDKLESDDCTTNNTPEEEVDEQADDNMDEHADDKMDEQVDDNVGEHADDNVNKHVDENLDEQADDNDDDNDDEEQDEDDTVENDLDEDETESENDYINDTKNEKDANKNKVPDDNEEENNYDDQGKLGTVYPNPQAEVTDGNKMHDKSIIVPKFIFQPIQDQQNNYEKQSLSSQLDSNDDVTPDGTKSEKISNKEMPSSEFQLSSGEFIDDYINNPQRKIPKKENKQPSNTGVITPYGNAAKSRIIPIQIPVFKNNFEEDNRSLYTTPSITENVKGQNKSLDQSQNIGNSLLSENNAFSLPVFNENRKDSNRNKNYPEETFPQNVKNAPSSADKPVFSTLKDENVNKFIPLNLLPFKKTSHASDLQNTLGVSHGDNNVFTEPAVLDFKNINFPVETPHNDIPATNIYKPKDIIPFQISPNQPVALDDDYYLNDQFENYNFQDKVSRGTSNEKAQQFEQNQPIVLQQHILPNNQYNSQQDTPNVPDETTYFTNYKPERPVNIPNVNRPKQGTEALPKYLTSTALQSESSFNEMYNLDSSPINTGNIMDKIAFQDQSDDVKPQNQINKDKTLNPKSDNLPFQDNFSGQQIQFPQGDIKKPLPQSELNNKAMPYDSKMSSEIIPTQDESKNTEFSQTQNITNSSRRHPHHSFRNAENAQFKPRNKDLFPVISDNIQANPPAKSSQPLTKEHQKNINFDESEGQTERTSSSGSDSSNKGRSDKPSRRNYGDEYEEDESVESTTLFEEPDSDEDDVEDDFVSENNYDFDDSTNEDEDEDDYIDESDQDDYIDESDQHDYADEDDYTVEDDQNNYADEDYEDSDKDDEIENEDNNDEDNYEDEDNYVYENNYGDAETKDDSSTQKSETAQNKNNGDIIAEAKSHNIKSNENSTSESKLINHDNVNNRLWENAIKSGDANDVIEQTENFKTQNEPVSSNQKEKFNTILEYIYEHSNNPLFKGIKDETN